MDSLVDLNTAAVNFLEQGDMEGIQRCIEYSLSSKRLLERLFETKRYDCVLPIAPLLRKEFYDENPTAMDICLDLLERKEALSALPLPSLKTDTILQRAITRKIAIDVNLRHEGHSIFSEAHKYSYYYRILTTDCLELFLVYEKEIMHRFGERIDGTVDLYFFPRILKAISRTEDWCKKSLSIALKTSILLRINSQDYDDLLLHLFATYDCRAKVYKHLFVKTQRCYLFHYKSLLKIAAEYDEKIAPKLKQVEPELYAKIFTEDV